MSLTDYLSIIGLESKATGRVLHDPETAVVKAAVVEAAQQHEVVNLRPAAVDPVLDMVSLGAVRRDAAAWEAAEPITYFERPAQWRWNGSPSPADIDRQSIAFGDSSDLTVASDPASNFPRERRTGFDEARS